MMMTYYLQPDRQTAVLTSASAVGAYTNLSTLNGPQTGGLFNDMQAMVRRINRCLPHTANGEFAMEGTIRVSGTPDFRLRVEDDVYAYLAANSSGSGLNQIGLTATEIANALSSAPPGDGTSGMIVPGIPRLYAKRTRQVVRFIGDSITSGALGNNHTELQKLYCQVFAGDTVEVNADRRHAIGSFRETFNYGFNSAMAANPNNRQDGGAAPYILSGIDGTTNRITAVNNQATAVQPSQGDRVVFTGAPAGSGITNGVNYFAGASVSSAFTIHNTSRDAMDGTNPITLASVAASGTVVYCAPDHTFYAPILWRHYLTYTDIQDVFVIFLGTNDMAYDGGPVGPGASVVGTRVFNLVADIKALKPAGAPDPKFVFVTAVARRNVNNSSVAAYRDYMLANALSNGFDRIVNTSALSVGGVNVLAPETAGATDNNTYYQITDGVHFQPAATALIGSAVQRELDILLAQAA